MLALHALTCMSPTVQQLYVCHPYHPFTVGKVASPGLSGAQVPVSAACCDLLLRASSLLVELVL